MGPHVASGVLDHTPDQSDASRDALNILRFAPHTPFYTEACDEYGATSMLGVPLLGLSGIVLHSRIEPQADVPVGERPDQQDRHIARHVGVTVTGTAMP